MVYHVYAFHPSAELVDVCDDLDDAVARCEELVQEERYPGAEVWDEDGDLVHAAGRSDAMQPSRSGFRPTRSQIPPPLPSGTTSRSNDHADSAGAGGEDACAADIERDRGVVGVEPPDDSPAQDRSPTDEAATASATTSTGAGATVPSLPHGTLLGGSGPVRWFGV